MAVAYQCDRCKKLFRGPTEKRVGMDPNVNNSTVKIKYFDLCDDCYSLIEKFIKEGAQC